MLFREAPQAKGYEFQSGGVVEMLKGLKDEFDTKKATLVEEETTAQHAFEQMMQQLTDNIENASHEASQRDELRQESKQAKAEAEGNLAQTTADLAEDQKYFDETTALCEQKANDFAARQQLRAEELEAIEKAIEVLSSGVAGRSEKYGVALMQSKAKAADRKSVV